MTAQEARIKLGTYASVNGSGRCTQAEYEEAKAKALEALKKQIPVKPILKTRKSKETFCISNTYFCPTCKQQLFQEHNTGFVYGKKTKCCYECGQAIDWSSDFVDIEVLEMAADALKKQIPVKPIHVIYTPINTKGYHGRKHHTVYCGVCGKFTQRVAIGDKYCRECGTRIDWSKDECTK